MKLLKNLGEFFTPSHKEEVIQKKGFKANRTISFHSKASTLTETTANETTSITSNGSDSYKEEINRIVS